MRTRALEVVVTDILGSRWDGRGVVSWCWVGEDLVVVVGFAGS